jgi:uncharacterized protein involved in exopolysaccharide biosynthesis/Mrp family chromosome partitioning ATPase
VSDELCVRKNRAQRLSAAPDATSADGLSRPVDDTGESAWDIGERLHEPLPRREKKDETPPVGFPPFPGLDDGEEEAPSGPGLDIMRFVRGVWKRRWLAVGIAFLITVLFGVLAFSSLHHKWQASAALIVRAHQDKFALTGEPFKPQEYNLKTLIDTVKLPSSLQAVIEATGVPVKTTTLAGAINVAPAKESDIFHIWVTWDDPRMAAEIANEVARLLIERTRSIRRQDAEDAYNYYNSQLGEVRDKLRILNAEMRQLQAKNEIFDFETEATVLLGNISNLEAEYNTKKAEARAMRVVHDRLERLIAEQPETVVLSTRYRSPLKKRLSDYEWQLQEARTRYSEQNPKLIKLKKRIAILEQMIEDSNDEAVPESTYAANALRADMELQLQELAGELKVQEAQVQALGQTLQSMRDKLDLITSSEKEYQSILSRARGAEILEGSLISRVNEARVIMLRNEASLGLFEAASPPLEPLPSGRKLVVAAGAVLGMGAGLFVVLALEFFDPVVRSRRDTMYLMGSELVWEFQRVPAGQHSVIDTRVPAEPVAALFRRVVNDFDAGFEQDGWRCLAVTSIEAGAGRSLVATNLAQALALKERPVILVDADLRTTAGERPSDLFELSHDRAGLWEMLDSGVSAGTLLMPTQTRGLRVLGPGVLSAAEEKTDDELLVKLGARQLRVVVAGFEDFDGNVLYDLPPLSAQETVLEAAAAVGNVLIVVRSGQTRRAELREIGALLRDRGINVCAALLTDVPADILDAKPAFASAAQGAGPFFSWFHRRQPKDL